MCLVLAIYISNKQCIDCYIGNKKGIGSVSGCIVCVVLLLFALIQHIGNIKLGFINKHHQKGQISLFIGEKNSWGKGYGKESIKAITQWGFKELHLERIEAGCYAGNTASLQAFLTVGFSVEGFLRNNFINGEHRCGSFLMGIIRNDQIN